MQGTVTVSVIFVEAEVDTPAADTLPADAPAAGKAKEEPSSKASLLKRVSSKALLAPQHTQESGGGEKDAPRGWGANRWNGGPLSA